MAVSSVRVTDGPVFHPPDRNKPLQPAANSLGAGPLPVNRKPPRKADGNNPPKKERKKSWMKECDSDGRPREKKRIFILNCGEMGVIFFGNILCTPQQQGTTDLHFQFTSDLHLLTRVFCSCSSVFSELTCMEKFAKLFKTLSN